MIARAPGKLVIAGEYVVLEGEPALVAAVDRYATAHFEPKGVASARTLDGTREGGLAGEEVRLARAACELRLGVVHEDLVIDISQLRQDNNLKYGIGSSSSACVAAVLAVFAKQGARIDLGTLLSLSLCAHRAVSPSGSGVDVVAATVGGWQKVTINPEGGIPNVGQAHAPKDVVLSAIYSGESQRTSEFVNSVLELRDNRRALYRGPARDIKDSTRALQIAAVTGDFDRMRESITTHHDAMAALGRAAKVSIVTEPLARIAELAKEHGGAAKPSGAGGGDCAIALFQEPSACDAFERACAAEGMTPLGLKFGARGAHLDSNETL